MYLCTVLIYTLIAVTAAEATASAESTVLCGCRMARPCYLTMVEELRERDEKQCMQDIEIGTSTMMVYFRALQKYCGEVFNFTSVYITAESRNLYEIVIHKPKDPVEPLERDGSGDVPIILVEAGQLGGVDPVRLSLYFIERLLACEENERMIQEVKWIFLPCTNPDGLEYVRFDRPNWTKNTRHTADSSSYGIDISRNFDAHWSDCGKKSALDLTYPGPSPESEIETKFVKHVLLKYKDQIKAYLSVRRRGQHGLLYPHSHSDRTEDVDQRLIKVADLVSMKVNQRGASLQAFLNDSIYRINGKPHCGNSVDYAHAQGIQMPFEFRVGFESDMKLVKLFQHVPKGYESILQTAYFSGLRELYSIITTQKNKKSDQTK